MAADRNQNELDAGVPGPAGPGHGPSSSPPVQSPRGPAPETVASGTAGLYHDGAPASSDELPSIADVVSANPERDLMGGDPRAALPEGYGRYVRRDTLGAGGMGEVSTAHDRAVGRDVAMKVVRPKLAGKRDLAARFLHEARVQGQLEHPAIVPVYDLGISPEGQLYFTMKRVRGRTLEGILSDLARQDAETAAKFTPRRVLADFSKLCLAVQYVHERGVLHRDLKPANVMLGDYGEVYLLDWGLAKVLDRSESEPQLGAESAVAGSEGFEPVRPHAVGSAPAHTQLGALVGTPGYMAPEQILESDRLDSRADVYALGAILFELLTGDRLHRGETATDLVESTLNGEVERRPSARAPHRAIPPELDALVFEATAPERHYRLPSALELHRELEAYLDGDRDVARRREAARAEVDAAASLTRAAIDAADDDARAEALRRLGHALALDPENAEALKGLVELLTQPPTELPASVAAELDGLEEQQTRGAGRVGAIAFASLNLYLPLMLWMGVHAWGPLVAFSSLTTLTAVISFVVSRLAHPRTVHAMAVLVSGLATASVSSAIFGPFVLAPSIVAVITLMFSLNHPPQWRGRIIALGVTAAFLPAILEAMAVLPPSMSFGDGGITLLPRVTGFPAVPSLVLLVLGNLAVVVTAGAAMAPIRRELDDAQAQVRTMAWQLRQLVPEAVDHGTAAHGVAIRSGVGRVNSSTHLRSLDDGEDDAPRDSRADEPASSAAPTRREPTGTLFDDSL